MVIGGGIKVKEGMYRGECVQHTIYTCTGRPYVMVLLYNGCKQ